MNKKKYNFGKNLSFQWNYSNSVIIGRKGFGKELNRESAKIMERHMFRFVPYLTGELSNRTRITAYKDHATITYMQPYANQQYTHTEYKHTKKYHPLATAYWDKAAWSADKNVIGREVNKARKRYSK